MRSRKTSKSIWRSFLRKAAKDRPDRVFNRQKALESMRASWRNELEPITEKDLGDRKQGDRLLTSEVREIEKMLKVGRSVGDIAKIIVCSIEVVRSHRYRLISEGVKLSNEPLRYIRREISYEKQTELPMLVGQMGLLSMDEVDADGESAHDRFSANGIGFCWGAIDGYNENNHVWLKSWASRLPHWAENIFWRIYSDEGGVPSSELNRFRAEALLVLM